MIGPKPGRAKRAIAAADAEFEGINMNQAKPILPVTLLKLGAELICHPPEDGTPVPWAVYDSADAGGDILGCGDTADEAIRDALNTVADWDIYRSIVAGRQ